MDKETQVLEMAKILCPKGTANCEKCSKNYKCDVKFSQLAELIDGGCQIVGEDEQIVNTKQLNGTLNSTLESGKRMGYAQGREETAREIIAIIIDDDGADLNKIAQKYGVELE